MKKIILCKFLAYAALYISLFFQVLKSENLQFFAIVLFFMWENIEASLVF